VIDFVNVTGEKFFSAAFAVQILRATKFLHQVRNRIAVKGVQDKMIRTRVRIALVIVAQCRVRPLKNVIGTAAVET